MNKPSTFIWVVFLFIIILPTPAGKLIIDLVGGIFLFLALIPLILGGIGFFTWQRIKSKVKICNSCGSSFLNDQITCPICGGSIISSNEGSDNIPASSATIDINTEEIK